MNLFTELSVQLPVSRVERRRRTQRVTTPTKAKVH
jgi:hypothetical protein